MKNKNNFKLSFFIFIPIFCLSLPFYLKAQTEIPFDNPEATISLDLQDANLKDVLKIFSIQSGLNFIASESVQDRKVTLYFDNTPIKNAMDKFFKVNNLSYEIDRDSNIIIVKDMGRPAIETVTKIFYLRYATVSSSSLKLEVNSQISTCGTKDKETEKESGIATAIKKLLSENGSLIEDPRTNSLIVTDTPTRMSLIEKVISKLDIPTPMVVLEVEMLDVSKDKVDKLGVEWPSILASLTVSGTRQTRFPFAGRGTSGKDYTIDPEKGIFDNLNRRYQWDLAPWPANQFGPSLFTFIGDTLILDFLRTQTDTKYLARPRLLTLNNETAEIKIATNESIGLKTTTTSAEGTGTTTAEAERVETGVILRVTPQVNLETGEITMFIYPRVAEAISGNPITSGSQTYVFRDPEERSTKTTVRVKDGETVVIGGLIRTEFIQTTKKLPLLGDIPLLGALFRHRGDDSDKNRERELLVFITPHIVKDSSFEFIQKINKVKSLTREQETTSVLQRNLAINSSLNSFEKR